MVGPIPRVHYVPKVGSEERKSRVIADSLNLLPRAYGKMNSLRIRSAGCTGAGRGAIEVRRRYPDTQRHCGKA